jgi:hypothetical protein
MNEQGTNVEIGSSSTETITVENVSTGYVFDNDTPYEFFVQASNVYGGISELSDGFSATSNLVGPFV